jgi:hypothetical protein
MVIVVVDDCAENLYQTSFVVVCEQLAPLLGPSFVASCKSPAAVVHATSEVNKTEFAQVLFAACPIKRDGAAIRNNKNRENSNFMHDNSFIEIFNRIPNNILQN